MKSSLYIWEIMNKIRLKNIKIYSNHGCLEEEKSIGSDYLFQLEVTSNLYNSSKSDNLEDTIDYVSLHNIISEEALRRSKLLENIAKRIVDRVFKEHPSIIKAKIEVEKLNPPIDGEIKGVSVVFKKSNK